MDDQSRTLIRRLVAGDVLDCTDALMAVLDQAGIGYEVSNGSVQLADTLELLDAGVIGDALSSNTRDVLSQLEIFWSLDSTNTYLLERVDSARFHGRVCTAEQQIAGKGRRGRRWVSPFGRNIYLSLGWEIPRDTGGVAGLSLVVGMVVAGVLRDAGLTGVGLKWPNDVIFNGGKVAGILVEMAAIKEGRFRLVIGIGINLGIDSIHAEQIDQAFSTAAGHLQLGRNRLLGLVLDGVAQELARFSTTGFAAYAGLWPEFDLYAGRPVLIKLADAERHGVNLGVDNDGNLMLETDDGLETYNAGEVSLRPT
jgi:BirA family biotin operon repressor/biotin-[acetyl-CoA-carboxylase] ligase